MRCSESQLGKRDGADTYGRRLVLEKPIRNSALSAKCEADGVGVEHEAQAHRNGSRSLPTVRWRGRWIGSDQAPRISTKSGGHSSTGSKITRSPSLRTKTSVCSSGKRHSLGRRTAWLLPF